MDIEEQTALRYLFHLGARDDEVEEKLDDPGRLGIQAMVRSDPDVQRFILDNIRSGDGHSASGKRRARFLSNTSFVVTLCDVCDRVMYEDREWVDCGRCNVHKICTVCHRRKLNESKLAADIYVWSSGRHKRRRELDQ